MTPRMNWRRLLLWLLPLLAVAAEPAVAPGFFQGAELNNNAGIEFLGPDEGYQLSRVPREVGDRLNERARLRAFAPAAGELRFNLKEGTAKLTLKYIEDRGEAVQGWPVLAEVWQGDYFLRWVEIRRDWTTIEVKLPGNLAQLAANHPRRRFDPALVRIVLPHMTQTRLLRLEGAVTPPRPDQLPARRYLAYGSSITNGFFATRPGDTYPMRVARALGADCINLGFGGGAHLEPEVADWIAARNDWDFATLELGINLIGRMPVDEFRARVERFVPAIAKGQPDKWLFVTDIFGMADPRFDPAKVQAYRQVVRECVARIGSPRVVYVDGGTLLQDMSGLLDDLLHPSSEGFGELAQRLETRIRTAMGPGAFPPSPSEGVP